MWADKGGTHLAAGATVTWRGPASLSAAKMAGEKTRKKGGTKRTRSIDEPFSASSWAWDASCKERKKAQRKRREILTRPRYHPGCKKGKSQNGDSKGVAHETPKGETNSLCI